MIEEIVKTIESFCGKPATFNTSFGQVNENTKSFKLGEDVIGENRYITTARIEEFEDHMEVIKLDVMVVNDEDFLDSNWRNDNGC